MSAISRPVGAGGAHIRCRACLAARAFVRVGDVFDADDGCADSMTAVGEAGFAEGGQLNPLAREGVLPGPMTAAEWTLII